LIDRSVLKGDDMLRTRFFFGFSVLFLAGGIVVTAQGHGNGPKSTHTTTAPKAAAPAPHTTTKAAPVKPVKTTQPTMKAQHPSPSPASAKTSRLPTTKSASATQPQSSPTKTQKTTDKTTTKTAATKPVKPEKAAETKLAKADKPAKSTKATTTSTSTSTKTTTGTTTTTELTPVQQKLQKNTNLAAKVGSRLPEGTDLMKAAEGFRNLGQFVAAANVSHNLQISFTELKAKMMTGMSLGQAIQAVRPLTASPTVEAQRAEYDARGMIAESEQTTAASTSTVPTATPTSTTAKPKVKTKNSAQ
jgi:hypothetical protein